MGIWNRLAVVSGALFTLAMPTYLVVSINGETAKRQETGLSDCFTMMERAGSDLTAEQCQEIWLVPRSYLGMDEWFESAMWSALGAAFLYALIWAIVWVAKWVWRGKTVDQ